MTLTGTFLNVGAVIIGGTIGVAFGNRLRENIRETVMASLGLITLVIGARMSITTHNPLVPLFATLFGGILGELLRLDDHLKSIGKALERRYDSVKRTAVDPNDKRATWDFTQAFITGTLIFCIGPLTFVGSFQQGLQGNYDLIVTNASLDFFVAIAFGASLGPGIIAACLSVLAVQTLITTLAVVLKSQIGSVTATTPWVVEFGAVGGVLILGVSAKLLEIKKIRLPNLLPAAVIAPLLVVALQRLGYW